MRLITIQSLAECAIIRWLLLLVKFYSKIIYLHFVNGSGNSGDGACLSVQSIYSTFANVTDPIEFSSN